MRAELEKQLTGPSLEEKQEAFSFLMPYITAEEGEDFEESPELLAELDRRTEEDDKHPERAIGLEEFKSLWAHRL